MRNLSNFFFKVAITCLVFCIAVSLFLGVVLLFDSYFFPAKTPLQYLDLSAALLGVTTLVIGIISYIWEGQKCKGTSCLSNSKTNKMTSKEELRKEFLRFYLKPSIQDSIELLEIYSNYLILIVANHQNDSISNIAEREAKIVNHMIFTKVLNLKQVIEGITYKSNTGITLNKIIDPTIVAISVRNIFETVGMFNLIYRHTRTSDERLILYNLWCIAGLSYRQKFKDVEGGDSHNLNIIEEERLKIESLTKEIENTNLYISLDIVNQRKIHTKIKAKDYLIQFSNKEVEFLHWHDLPQVMGIEEGLFDKMYNYFSLYTHPSNVSVFQFENLFSEKDKAFLEMTKFNLKYAFILLSIFIADYLKLFPSNLKTFESIDIIDQILINSYNTLGRPDGFSINDSSKHLE